jgi:hypothetical protein
MANSVVCDAGGVLVASGVLEGAVPPAAEILALDWSALTIENNPRTIPEAATCSTAALQCAR